MKAIIKKEGYCCEHEKPHPKAFLSKVPCWQTRTCSIQEFDERFSKNEGTWKSKGKNHKEIPRPFGSSGDDVWCTRKMPDTEMWCIEIKSMEKFIRENNFVTFYVSQENEDMIVVTI